MTRFSQHCSVVQMKRSVFNDESQNTIAYRLFNCSNCFVHHEYGEIRRVIAAAEEKVQKLHIELNVINR